MPVANTPQPVAGTGPSESRKAIVQQAADQYHVPFNILWGVFGAESTWGTNGSNWFGLVAVPRTGSFQGDAQASARTLSTLYNQHGHNWEQALRAYSGGDYGLDHVVQLGSQPGADPHANELAPQKAIGDAAGAVGGAIGDAAGAVASTAKLAGWVFDHLTDPHFWLHVVEVIGGIVLVIMALHELAGQGAQQGAQSAGRVAAAPARKLRLKRAAEVAAA